MVEGGEGRVYCGNVERGSLGREEYRRDLGKVENENLGRHSQRRSLEMAETRQVVKTERVCSKSARWYRRPGMKRREEEKRKSEKAVAATAEEEG